MNICKCCSVAHTMALVLALCMAASISSGEQDDNTSTVNTTTVKKNKTVFTDCNRITDLSVTQTYKPPAGYEFAEVYDDLDIDRSHSIAKFVHASIRWDNGWDMMDEVSDTSGNVTFTLMNLLCEMPEDAYDENFVASAWGKLEAVAQTSGGRTGGGGTASLAEWSGIIGSGYIQILRTPGYLYSRATAAAPIKFAVAGFGTRVKITSLRAELYVDGEMKESCDLTNRFASGDGVGTSQEGNGTTDTYTVWYPCSYFNDIDIRNDTTTDVAFGLSATVEIAINDGTAIVTVCSSHKPFIRPAVFGDRDVKIIELSGYSSPGDADFAFRDGPTKQPRVAPRPQTRLLHMMRHFERPHGHDGRNCEMGWDEAKQVVIDDGAVLGADLNLYDSSDPWANSTQIGGHWTTNEADSLYGAYMGFSYGHLGDRASTTDQKPKLLGDDEKAMDLAYEMESVTVSYFDGCTIELECGDINVNPGPATITNVPKLVVGIVKTAVGLCGSGWGAAISVVNGYYDIISSIKAYTQEDKASAYAAGGVHVSARGSPYTTPERFHYVQEKNGKQTLADVQLEYHNAARVGDTWIGTLGVGASGTARSQLNSAWEKVWACSKITLPSGSTWGSHEVKVGGVCGK